MIATPKPTETFATMPGVLLQVRLLGSDGHTCLIQNRDTDIRIRFKGRRSRDSENVYLWFSENEDRWMRCTQSELLANTTEFKGWFEVHRA